ncbi:EutN/CcmL family microcompartment protein [Candidatus Formimonas warabiya]|uniref:Ethanolamine utilization protein EutN n=1 Tax=Formimonas warabiya TaxID=1761012 RepID=A0A3G1L010_FORW1|nr:EutN/CcmL family microcompartment protein [Candidatus Formimonas warabiya]ATW27981.1 ethanolamine utilization protein EutN [Candidatus Formimonas warabiya]
MQIAKVVGTVVSTKKDANLIGYKLLMISPLERNGRPKDSVVVAVDAVGAGIGEVVLVVTGSTARQAVSAVAAPIDAAIIGIVDTMEGGSHENLY